MKKAQLTDKNIRARKYRGLRTHIARWLGSHERWSENPVQVARNRAFLSATSHSLERALADDDVFEAYCQRLEQAILARKRTR